MRTFGTAFQSAIEASTGSDWAVAVEVTDPDTGNVRGVSTRALTVGGITYAAELLEVGSLYESISRAADDIRIEMLDTTAARAGVKLGALVIVRVFTNITATSADTELFFKGQLSDPVQFGGGRVAFDVVSNRTKHESALIGDVLSADDYAGIDPAAVGQIAAVVYGSVSQVPARGIDTGSISTLTAQIDDSQTTCELTSAAAFPATGTVQVGLEQMSYTSIVGSTLTGLTRAANGTTAAAHDPGMQCVEIQTEYIYLIAAHPIEQVAALYIDGVRQISNSSSTLNGAITDAATSLIVDDATEFPAKGTVTINSEDIHYASITTNTLNSLTRGVNGTTAAAHADEDVAAAVEWQIDASLAAGARLTFFAPPTLDRLGTIEIDVNDSITVSDSGHSHVGTTGTTTASASSVSLGVTNPNNLVDANAATFAYSNYAAHGQFINGSAVFTVSGGTTGRTLTNYDIRVKGHVASGIAQEYLEVNGHRFTAAELGGGATPPQTVTKSNLGGGAWTLITAPTIKWSNGFASPGGQVDIYEIEILNVDYQNTDSTDAVANVFKSGTVDVTGSSTASAVIGTDITLDIAGKPDDDGNAITSPDGIAQSLLETYGGLDALEVAGSEYSAINSVPLAFAITAPTALGDVLEEVTRQSRSSIIYSGGAYKFRRRAIQPAQVYVSNPDTTVGDALIARDDDGASSARYSLIGLSSLINRVQYRGGQSLAGEWSLVGVIEDAISQARVGTRSAVVDFPMLFESVELAATAQWYADRAITSGTRRLVSVRSTMAALQIEPGDVVRLTPSKIGIDIIGEVIATGPKHLSRDQGGQVALLIEELVGSADTLE